MTVTQPGASAQASARSIAITFEIVRHRLWSIADEMALTLIRTAGNPSITEAHDFMVALFTANGNIALGGWGGNRHVSCTALACKGILDRFPLEDVHADDVFLLNDPYVAAIHQPDVYVISPVHFDGELVGWTCNFTHLPDIGGIDPGSSPRATDVRQEGLRMPGLKIADRGVLRWDVWDTLLNMTREPEMNALQLKAQIAANNTGKAKLQALLSKIGVEQYRAIVDRMMSHSEEGLRSRLRELPDGTWRTREYFDTQDRIYTVELAMTKEGDELSFDFTGTSEQAPSFINCTYWGTRGGIFVAVSNMLGHGLPWNEGLLRPLHLTVPEGTLLNCRFPAPVSMGTVAGSRLATIAAWSTVSHMLAMSGQADEASALWSASATGLRISGMNRDKRYFVLTPFEHVGGGGARLFADGVDTGGGFSNPMGAVPNVETIERNAPVLYLYRRHLPDSGGPGANRGGVCTETAFTVHKAPEGKLSGVLFGSGREPSQSHGVFGGLPACNTGVALHTSTGIRATMKTAVPVDLEGIGGAVQLMPPQGLLDINEDGVVRSRSDGGGGFADPLLRAPERVARDVLARLVSPEQARRVYGVVLDGQSEVDAGATVELRSDVRKERLGSMSHAGVHRPTHGEAGGLLPVRYDREKQEAFCAHCARSLGPLQESWKTQSIKRVQPLSSLGPLMTSTLFVAEAYVCPGCGTLLDVEMKLPGDPAVNLFSPPRQVASS